MEPGPARGGAGLSEPPEPAEISDAEAERQREDFLAAKMASRRDFIARQRARTPEERLQVMAAIGRRVAALRAWKDAPSSGPGSEPEPAPESPGGPGDPE